ncbi:hypothetical protein VaNZ11_009863 [Volvox africanus]|uniref:C3H1-type domain-containing protein n=1 Tax=Volvox africanus TaxID=51714 RepID=A0ABQ5S891_9CHLO|nr:hypothetical protein VaNZ11_009863 [Volvox africanus]
MQPPKLCIQFQRGFCSYGSKCRFMHQQFGAFSGEGGRSNGPRWTQTRGRGGRGNAQYCYYQESHFQTSGSAWTSGSRRVPTREWSSTPNDGNPLQQGTSFTFRFMCWNILADELAHTHAAELYPQSHHSYLDWPKRLGSIIRHVTEQRPDVLCLQEVDDWVGLREELAALGYDGVHVQRTGGRGDGCATLWLRERLRLSKSPGTGSRFAAEEIRSSSESSPCGSEVHRIHMAAHDLKDNVALLVHLTPRCRAGTSTWVSEPAGAGVGSADDPNADSLEGSSSVSHGDSSRSNDGSCDEVSEPPERPTGRRPKRTRQSSEGGAADADVAEVAAAAVTEAIASLRPYPVTAPADDAAAAAVTGLSHAASAPSRLQGTQGRQRQQQHDGGGGGGGNERPMGRGTSGNAVQPSSRSVTDRGFWVANTHVLFNTKRGDIKLGQLRVILSELATRALAAGPEDVVPVIFAGDFNTSPGSGLYRFLRYGELPLAGEDRRELSGQVEGYGFEQLQWDMRAGRAPRLARWSPAPELRNPQAMWKLQQQEPQRFLNANGRSYRVRWEEEELVHAMGSVAVEQAIASIREAAFGKGSGSGINKALNLRHASSTGAMTTGWYGRSGGGGNGGSTSWRERDATAAAELLAVTEAAVLRHPLHLRSAYAAVDEQGREPLFTTMHARYVGTVDFVWYTPGDEQAGGGGGGGGEGEGGGGSSSRSRGADCRSMEGIEKGSSAAEAETEAEAETGQGGGGGGRRDSPGSHGFHLTPVRVLHPPNPLSYPYGMPCADWPSDHVSLVVDFRLSCVSTDNGCGLR